MIKPKKPSPLPKPPGGGGTMPKLPPKGGPQAPPKDPGPVFRPHPGGGIQKPKKRPGRP